MKLEKIHIAPVIGLEKEVHKNIDNNDLRCKIRPKEFRQKKVIQRIDIN
jgi:hypothetical protein